MVLPIDIIEKDFFFPSVTIFKMVFVIKNIHINLPSAF